MINLIKNTKDEDNIDQQIKMYKRYYMITVVLAIIAITISIGTIAVNLMILLSQ